jgi:hypothetical protein
MGRKAGKTARHFVRQAGASNLRSDHPTLAGGMTWSRELIIRKLDAAFMKRCSVRRNIWSNAGWINAAGFDQAASVPHQRLRLLPGHALDLRTPGESSSDFTDWMRGKNRLIAPTASAPWPKRKGDYQWPGLAISSVYPCFRRECRFSITAISDGPISG